MKWNVWFVGQGEKKEWLVRCLVGQEVGLGLDGWIGR